MLEPLFVPLNAEVAKCLKCLSSCGLSRACRSTVTQRHFWETLSDSDTEHQKLGRQVNWQAGSCEFGHVATPACHDQSNSEVIINIVLCSSSRSFKKNQRNYTATSSSNIPFGIFVSNAVGKASCEQQLMVTDCQTGKTAVGYLQETFIFPNDAQKTLFR